MRHANRPLGPDETVEILRRKILGELPLRDFQSAAVPATVPTEVCELPLTAPAGESRVMLLFTPRGCDIFSR